MNAYFDNAATTQIDDRVFESMKPYLTKEFYNPSSLYHNARKVRDEIENARRLTARVINGKGDEIIFTSGGTEADNLAVKGTAWSNAGRGRHLITSEIEHHAVLDSFKWMETQGFSVTYLPVNSLSIIEPRTLAEAIRPDTILVSIMWVNNETGSIQPIDELVRIAHKNGAIFHTDAVQAIGTEYIDVHKLGIDLLSLSGHKIYGPKGVGALYCREGIELTPVNHGGQQERHVRGGTESSAGIIGLGKAMELLYHEREERRQHLLELKKRFLENIKNIDGVRINGYSENSAPGILNIGIAGIDAEPLLILLDQAGIQASMGSACTSRSIEPSYVLKAMKVPEEYIRGSLRLSMGEYNTSDEIDYASEKLIEIIERLRS